MELAVPLTQDQIAAAGRLHGLLEQWRQSDAALVPLQATPVCGHGKV